MVFTVWCVCNWLARTKVWPRLPPSDTSGMNCQPGLVTQHQWLTSVKLLWLNGSKSPQSGSQIMWKAWNQKSGGRLMSNNHVFVLVSVYFWLGSALRMNLLLEFKGKEMISLVEKWLSCCPERCYICCVRPLTTCSLHTAEGGSTMQYVLYHQAHQWPKLIFRGLLRAWSKQLLQLIGLWRCRIRVFP